MKFAIRGGAPLKGDIRVSGAKNAALKIFPVALLTREPIRVVNVPEIEDVSRAGELVTALGHEVKKIRPGTIELCSRGNLCNALPEALVGKFRASVMFAGPLLAACGEVRFPHPGGCALGAGGRPIDLFISGFKKMGARVAMRDGEYRMSARRLHGASIFFPKISVMGTESLMMTAAVAEGVTVLKNCAMEPEIPALAAYLNRAGAKIHGAGTPTITIRGVKRLRGGEYRLIPDRLETGSFAMLGAAVKGSDITIRECDPSHLESLWALFDAIGVRYTLGKTSIHIRPSPHMKSVDVTTHEYPGFATDLQSPYTVLMTQAQGQSLIHETIYDRRLLYTDLLVQMGAQIVMADPHRVMVTGPTRLYGRKLVSPDIRAGIALVIAALAARGTTEIDNTYQIERGYERIDERLRGIGADIKRIG